MTTKTTLACRQTPLLWTISGPCNIHQQRVDITSDKYLPESPEASVVGMLVLRKSRNHSGHCNCQPFTPA